MRLTSTTSSGAIPLRLSAMRTRKVASDRQNENNLMELEPPRPRVTPCRATIEHDPEKWNPVFGKDHAHSKSDAPGESRWTVSIRHARGSSGGRKFASCCGEQEAARPHQIRGDGHGTTSSKGIAGSGRRGRRPCRREGADGAGAGRA